MNTPTTSGDERWSALSNRLAGLFANNRGGGRGDMGGPQGPLPSETRAAREFVDELRAATSEENANLAAEVGAWHAQCDKVGVPYDPEGLVRHHRGNAAMTAGADALGDVVRAERMRDDAIATRDAISGAVRALHRPCREVCGDDDNFCHACLDMNWPCPTIRALGLAEGRTEPEATPATETGDEHAHPQTTPTSAADTKGSQAETAAKLNAAPPHSVAAPGNGTPPGRSSRRRAARRRRS